MPHRLPELTYIISRDAYKTITATRGPKDNDSKTYVMKTINETFGLLGTITQLEIED